MKESGFRLNWTTVPYQEKPKTFGATNHTNGMENMRAIKKHSNWREKFPVFAWCADLGPEWYIPAIEELLMFTENEIINDKVDAELIRHGGDSLKQDGSFSRAYYSSTEVFSPLYPEYPHLSDEGSLWILEYNPFRGGSTKSLASAEETMGANVRPIATF